MSGHSPIGASIAHRWLACTKSVEAAWGLENASSPAAEEGTAAHEVAAGCLLTGGDAAAHVGEERRTALGRGIEVTDEMAEAVQVYLDAVRADLAATPGGVLLVEHPFQLPQVHAECWGTCDAVIVQPLGRIRVYDYKHGRGHVVEVRDNPQAKFYGLGALAHDEAWGAEDVELIIVQPRAYHRDGPVRRYTVPGGAEELRQWGETVLRPAAEKAMSFRDFGLSDGEYAPGEHCGFCPRAGTCPALRERALATARTDFRKPAPPKPETLTREELGAVLDALDVLEDWASSVRAHARRMCEVGNAPVGSSGEYKLVEIQSRRKWAADGKVILDAIGNPDLLYQRTQRSPAQVEAELKKLGKKPKEIAAIIAPLTMKPQAGTALAPASDQRPAAQPRVAFTPIVADEQQKAD